MNVKRMNCWIAGAAVALGATDALASAELMERSTKTKGATTITWDSSFHDVDYTLGDTVTFTVNWDVDAGAAEYSTFRLRRFTPRSRRDPAAGNFTVVSQSGDSVTIEATFTDLHLDRELGVEHGKAHLKLYLMVDEDGDGEVDTRAGYGLNLRAEDWNPEMGSTSKARSWERDQGAVWQEVEERLAHPSDEPDWDSLWTASEEDGPEAMERSTKTKGATTITWDSSFHDVDYTLGDTVTFTVNWDVDAGAAAYATFRLRRFTPKSRRDPAEGHFTVVSQSEYSVTIEATFTDLHLDRELGVEHGKAHLKLYLMVDEDGDGEVDTRAGYGVNLRVEDWQ